MKREFWFSQALEDAEGDPWPVGVDTWEDPHIYSDGGLIERRGETYYAEGHLRPWHDLDFDDLGLPADAVRLWPVEDVLRFGIFVTNGAMTRADVERAYTRWLDWEESKSG